MARTFGFAAILAGALAATGCTSSLSTVAAHSSFQQLSPAISEPRTDAAALALAVEEPALKTDAAVSAAEATAFPLATVVPSPAPRDGPNNPLLLAGAVMAIAFEPPSGDTLQAKDRTLTAGVQIASLDPNSGAGGLQSAGPKPSGKTQSLFEILLQRQQARAARTGGLSAGSAIPLPGVRIRQDLFGIESEEHEEDGAVRVAAVGGFGRMSATGLRLQTEKVDVHCFEPGLLAILKQVERHYGKIPVVTSGYRSAAGNRRAGGARRSLHVECKAADIQVEGVAKWTLARYLRTVSGRGGVGTYCRTESVHIDTGEERDWHYPCRRIKKRRVSV